MHKLLGNAESRHPMVAGFSSLPASSSSDLNKNNVYPVAPNVGMRRMQQRHVQALSVDIPVHTFRKRGDGLRGHSLTLIYKRECASFGQWKQGTHSFFVLLLSWIFSLQSGI